MGNPSTHARIAASLIGALVAVAVACGSESSKPTSGLGGGPSFGNAGGGQLPGADAGDGGADGGDGGLDGGCGTTPDLRVAADRCASSLQTHSVQVIADGGCGILIYFDTVLTCSGHLSGAANAFDGSCGTPPLHCQGPSLPGSLTCSLGTDGGCRVDLCSSLNDPLCQ